MNTCFLDYQVLYMTAKLSAFFQVVAFTACSQIYIYILYHQKKNTKNITMFQVGEHIIFPFSTLGSEPCPSKNGLIQKKHPKALLITKKR